MVANGVLAIIQLITASKGNLMKKFTLLASLLTLGISTAQAIVIPDLFGSYERGAEAARQYIEIFKNNENLDCTFFSHAIEIHQ